MEKYIVKAIFNNGAKRQPSAPIYEVGKPEQFSGKIEWFPVDKKVFDSLHLPMVDYRELNALEAQLDPMQLAK